MLMFKKAGYNKKTLRYLSTVMGDALQELMSTECVHDCAHCQYKYPCDDMYKLVEYLEELIDEAKR